MNDRRQRRTRCERPLCWLQIWNIGAVTLVAVTVLALVSACTSAGSPPAPESFASAERATRPAASGEGPSTDTPFGPITSEPVLGDAAAPTRTVEESGAFKVTAMSSNACQADAPDGWTMQANDRSNAVDLVSPDGTMYAGYGIQAVNTAIALYAGAYPAPLNDPDLYSADPSIVARAYARAIVARLGGATDLVYSGALSETIHEYRLESLAGSTHGGVVFFRATPYPGDGVNESYILPMYWAVTTNDLWSSDGPLVARVAASIRCTTQFQPPRDYLMAAAGSDGSSGSGQSGADAGYNPWLGTEYVTNPDTGQNYLVDPSENWSETGPDGPGYYAQNGNDWLKLQPGRSD